MNHSRKEVCLDARLIGPSGIGTYLKNLIPRLKSAPFSLKLIVHPACVEREKWLNGHDLILCEAPIYSVREQLALPRLIPSCDLFWSPHSNVPLLPIRAKKRLLTLHDMFYLAPSSPVSFWKRQSARFLINAGIKRADRIVTVSEFSKGEILKYTQADARKISVIYNGVDALECPPIARKNRPYILFVGQRPHKNMKGVIGALALLQKEKCMPELLVVGERKRLARKGGLFSLLAENPSLLAYVHVREGVEREELVTLYANAAALVFPSFYEGFGLPPLEAMRVGCPAIVARAASLPEVCGDAAHYVDPYSPQDIARGIRNVLEDETLRTDLIAKGKERSALFSWDETTRKHIHLINQMLRNS